MYNVSVIIIVIHRCFAIRIHLCTHHFVIDLMELNIIEIFQDNNNNCRVYTPLSERCSQLRKKIQRKELIVLLVQILWVLFMWRE